MRTRKPPRFATVFLLSLGVGLFVWIGAVRPRNGEVQRIADTPLIGPYLSPLDSIQPVLYHARLGLSGKIRAVLFRGMTSENNVHAFAVEHNLAPVTNEVSRAKFLSQSVEWKVDLQRFPIFNGPTDLCYTGAIPKNSQQLFQICHRPSDGRFTALAFNDAYFSSAANKAESPQN
jgi:hypothetical protein